MSRAPQFVQLLGGRLPIDPNPGTFPPKSGEERAMSKRAAQVEKSLSYQFPYSRRAPFAVGKIDVPANLDITTGMAAWWGITTINAPQAVGQEGYWTGYHLSLSPCDVAGTGRVNYPSVGTWLKWGDDAASTNNRRNSSAYIVIGTELPWVRKGTWTPGPALPNQHDGTGADAPSVYAPDVATDAIAIAFPSGDQTIATTIPTKKTVVESFLPMAIPLPKGARLSVALVVRRGVVQGLGSLSAIGIDVVGALSIGLRRSDNGFWADT